MMIPARHMPSMIGRNSAAYGSSSALSLGQPNLLDHNQQLQQALQQQHLLEQIPATTASAAGRRPTRWGMSSRASPAARTSTGTPSTISSTPTSGRARSATTTTPSTRSKRWNRACARPNFTGVAVHREMPQTEAADRPTRCDAPIELIAEFSTARCFFMECPHPDDKQRKELSLELGLEPLQVKFWFQNKRTQMKNQHERQENSQLRAENDKLRAEKHALQGGAQQRLLPQLRRPRRPRRDVLRRAPPPHRERPPPRGDVSGVSGAVPAGADQGELLREVLQAKLRRELGRRRRLAGQPAA